MLRAPNLEGALPVLKAGKVIRAKPEGRSGIFRFPFEVLDSSADNLGRIEWHLEAHWQRRKDQYYIRGLLLWATQTHDRRYKGKTLWLPCFTGIISTQRKPEDFFARVWRMGFCNEHRVPVFSAYPDDHHRVLEFQLESSISAEIQFVGEKDSGRWDALAGLSRNSGTDSQIRAQRSMSSTGN